MAWSTPKTDWATDYLVGTADFNRIEGNIADMRMNAAANGRMGTASVVLSGGKGTATVNNTSITANTKIFLTVRSTTGSADETIVCYCLTISAGASFTIKVISSSGSVETVGVDYLLFEPQ